MNGDEEGRDDVSPVHEDIGVAPGAQGSSARSRAEHVSHYDLEDVVRNLGDQEFDGVETARTEEPSIDLSDVASVVRRAVARPTEEELVATKRSPLLVCKDVFGDMVKGRILALYEGVGSPSISACVEALRGTTPCKLCAGDCPNGKMCYEALGGIAVVHARRCDFWPCVEVRGVERTDGGAAKKRVRYTNNPRAARKQVLLEYLNCHVRVDSNDDDGVATTIVYRLRNVMNEPTVVCKCAWHKIAGVGSNDNAFRKMYKSAKVRVMQLALEQDASVPGAVLVLPAGTEDFVRPKAARLESTRAANTFAWLAHQTEHFADPMPHKSQLVLHWATWKSCHDACGKTHGEQNMDKPTNILGYRAFNMYRADSPTMIAAVDRTVRLAMGPEAYNAACDVGQKPVWQVVPKNPRKNETFGRCKTCCNLDAIKSSAALTGNKERYKESKALFSVHYTDFMSRRERHNKIMKEAVENPDEVLTICIDAIDKRKMQSPILPPSIRRDKSFAQMKRFPLVMVGAIAHGHAAPGDQWAPDGQNRYLIFYDALLGNHSGLKGAGANETLTTLMCVLDDLREKNLLPTASRRRVLHAQFDNCSTNKNQDVLAFLSLLVATNMFTEIRIDFLLVGHTHVLIDQWFRVISEDIFMLKDVSVATTPLLQKYLAGRFCCTVLNLDCFTDFHTMIQPFKAKITGHSEPYSYKVTRDQGHLKASYQTSQRADGEWYEMSVPLRVEPDDVRFAVAAMPLKTYEMAMPGYTEVSGEWESDDVSKFIDAVRKKITSVNRAQDLLGGVRVDDGWLAWWAQCLSDMRDESVRARRTADPGHPFKASIDLSRPRCDPSPAAPVPPAARHMGSAAIAELNLIPPDGGPCVRVTNSIAGLDEATSTIDDFALRLQRIALKIRTNSLHESELPRKGDLIVWQWSTDSGNEGLALGLVHTNPQEEENVEVDGWKFTLRSYMPRGWADDETLCQDPAKFANANFAPEMIDKEETKRTRKKVVKAQHQEEMTLANVVLTPQWTACDWRFSGGHKVTTGGKITGIVPGTDGTHVQEFIRFACEHVDCTSVDFANSGGANCTVCARALRAAQRENNGEGL